jgi:hypothetical protein
MMKGQSALEYMMTYGWAILIIVIVAVILYSMGIFNPGASITTASSGFSPFAVSAAVCNTSGLYVAFTTGGLPNGASSASALSLTVSAGTGIGSGSGGPYAGPVSPGTTFTIKATSTCATSGVRFSTSGTLSYSVTTAVGTTTNNATGTIAGTSS